MMLKKALRAVLVAVALLAALAGPFVSTAYADCGSAGSGTICPR